MRFVLRMLQGALCPLVVVPQPLCREGLWPNGQDSLGSANDDCSSHSSSTELRAPDSCWRFWPLSAMRTLARDVLSSACVRTAAGVRHSTPRWQRPTVPLKGCVPKGCAYR